MNSWAFLCQASTKTRSSSIHVKCWRTPNTNHGGKSFRQLQLMPCTNSWKDPKSWEPIWKIYSNIDRREWERPLGISETRTPWRRGGTSPVTRFLLSSPTLVERRRDVFAPVPLTLRGSLNPSKKPFPFSFSFSFIWFFPLKNLLQLAVHVLTFWFFTLHTYLKFLQLHLLLVFDRKTLILTCPKPFKGIRNHFTSQRNSTSIFF